MKYESKASAQHIPFFFSSFIFKLFDDGEPLSHRQHVQSPMSLDDGTGKIDDTLNKHTPHSILQGDEAQSDRT